MHMKKIMTFQTKSISLFESYLNITDKMYYGNEKNQSDFYSTLLILYTDHRIPIFDINLQFYTL